MYMYHGTIKENADQILKNGFKKYSYFTPYLSTALSYGGEYIFIISDNNITDKDLGDGKWEFIYDKEIKPDDIIALVHYDKVDLIYYNIDILSKLKHWSFLFMNFVIKIMKHSKKIMNARNAMVMVN